MDPLEANHNQTISSPALSLPHIRGAPGRQMQLQGNMDIHCVHRAVSGSALHLRNLGTICLPQCSQRTFLAPKKISQKNISTIFPFFAPLSQWLLQIEAHVPISLHKMLVFSFCTPRYTLLPVFCHQQTTIETNRSSTHLSGM